MNALLQIEMLESFGIAVAIFAAAIFFWRSNGRLMNALSLMLAACAIEILFAIAADYNLDKMYSFAIIKILGRNTQAVGVVYFILRMIKIGKLARQEGGH